MAVHLRTGMPYIVEGSSWYLLDTGSTVTFIKNSPQAPLSKLAQDLCDLGSGAPGSGAPRDVVLPPNVDGILGWNWFSKWKTVTFDLVANQGYLHLDAGTPFLMQGSPSFSGSFKNKPCGNGLLPFSSFNCYGVSQSECSNGIIDTGAPVSIVSPALADQASLFDIQDKDILKQQLTIMGADGKLTTLLPKLAAGVIIGGGIQRAKCRLYRGDLPMMHAVGLGKEKVALIGLDLLGRKFSLDLELNNIHVWDS